jgi:arylsulfatase
MLGHRTDDATVDPRFGKVGKQKIEDTGPLTKKRMETIDDETCQRRDRLHAAPGAGEQAVLLLVERHAHARLTHVRPEQRRQAGISEYVDGMLEHDGHVGQLLKALDDLGIANDTIVVYTTDNGPHMNTWPDGP